MFDLELFVIASRTFGAYLQFINQLSYFILLRVFFLNLLLVYLALNDDTTAYLSPFNFFLLKRGIPSREVS